MVVKTGPFTNLFYHTVGSRTASPKDFGFASVLTTVAAGDTTTIYGHLAQLHLTPGHYRLCKPIASKTLSDDFFIISSIMFPTEIYR